MCISFSDVEAALVKFQSQLDSTLTDALTRFQSQLDVIMTNQLNRFAIKFQQLQTSIGSANVAASTLPVHPPTPNPDLVSDGGSHTSIEPFVIPNNMNAAAILDVVKSHHHKSKPLGMSVTLAPQMTFASGSILSVTNSPTLLMSSRVRSVPPLIWMIAPVAP